ncbi:hypothetical protein M758_UG052900 [Ceratodon purpureus]|nr:hypothetical protein M758_UG052900 [Ceratodon purpureus]
MPRFETSKTNLCTKSSRRGGNCLRRGLSSFYAAVHYVGMSKSLMHGIRGSCNGHVSTRKRNTTAS